MMVYSRCHRLATESGCCSSQYRVDVLVIPSDHSTEWRCWQCTHNFSDMICRLVRRYRSCNHLSTKIAVWNQALLCYHNTCVYVIHQCGKRSPCLHLCHQWKCITIICWLLHVHCQIQLVHSPFWTISLCNMARLHWFFTGIWLTE